jgi:hypothetical protein
VDIADRTQFYPFSLTRSLADLRVGIFSLKERWEAYLGEETGVFTVSYLQSLYEQSEFLQTKDPLFFINITCIPTPELITQIQNIREGGKLMDASGKWIASHTKERNIQKVLLPELAPVVFDKVHFIVNALHFLQLNSQFIQKVQFVRNFYALFELCPF